MMNPSPICDIFLQRMVESILSLDNYDYWKNWALLSGIFIYSSKMKCSSQGNILQGDPDYLRIEEIILFQELNINS